MAERSSYALHNGGYGYTKNIFAQDIGDEIHSMQEVLDQLYTDMLPLCSSLISVGRGLAGFAALWYISSRVWRQLVNSEPIDFYPLFRPL